MTCFAFSADWRFSRGNVISDEGVAADEPVVLVVEDEVLIRMFAADVLMEAGFKVFEAVNADEAVELLHARPDVHAVVTDVEMPGTMNGLALAEKIAQRWPGIAVLVNSGRVHPNGALPHGVGFISKPYLPEKLVELLRELLEIKSALSSLCQPGSD